MTVMQRELNEVNHVLKLAKLNEDGIKPVSQVIYFAPENVHQNTFKLVQLNEELISEISEGKTLEIKGSEEEELVICSETRTFHVMEAETSNSLLLATNLKFNEDIKTSSERELHKVVVYGIFHEYLEAIIGTPRLKKLYDLLGESVYKGSEHESEVTREKLYTFPELRAVIQASNKELKEALDSMDVIEIDGKIRLLDFEYHFRILSYMLKLIEENSWQLDEIDYEETLNALKDLAPVEVLNNLFDKYTEESQIIDGLQLYRYKEVNVCEFFAKVLLHQAGKFNFNEFLQAWHESVPEGMIPTEEMLYGIAIIDKKSHPNVISSFEESTLPENISERFRILFEKKEKWTVPEITPYIKRLTTDKLDVNALLAKYARASKVNGVKFYSAKHAK